MKVRIIKCDKEGYWYINFMGWTFEVIDMGFGYRVIDKYKFLSSNKVYHILKKDAIVIDPMPISIPIRSNITTK